MGSAKQQISYDRSANRAWMICTLSDGEIGRMHYADEFKIEAVRQVSERSFTVADVADRLGITAHSLYAWLRKLGKPDVVQRAELDQSAEIRCLKAELCRITEERDIVRKAAA